MTSRKKLNEVLQGYGLPTIQIVDDRKVTVKDIYTGEQEVIEFMPENRIVFLSEGVGNFLVGPTVENGFQPGIVLEAKDVDEPIQSILRAVAAGFPAVEDPALIFRQHGISVPPTQIDDVAEAAKPEYEPSTAQKSENERAEKYERLLYDLWRENKMRERLYGVIY